MRLFRRFFVIALALILGANAFAGEYFRPGIRAGVSANWIPGTVDSEFQSEVLPFAGIYAGVSFDTGFTEFPFFWHAELLYARKGHYDRTELTSSSYLLDISYVEIPVLLGLKMPDGKFSMMFGPEVAYCIAARGVESGRDYKDTADMRGQCRPFNFGLGLQANYMITYNFGIDLKVDYGLTKTFTSGNVEMEGHDLTGRGHNTSVMLGLCYCFGY